MRKMMRTMEKERRMKRAVVKMTSRVIYACMTIQARQGRKRNTFERDRSSELDRKGIKPQELERQMSYSATPLYLK